MLKRFCVLLAVCFLLMFTLVAYAGELPLPGENLFYSQHKDECVLLWRMFHANGENGSVSVKEAPGSESEISVIENDGILPISCTYKDCYKVWICISDPENDAIPAFNPPRPVPWRPSETP